MALEGRSRKGIAISYLVLMFAMHFALVGYLSWTRSPNVDEAAHLAAGLYHWQTGCFDVYRVNPPLVRMVATFPLRSESPRWPTGHLLRFSEERSEWRMGEQLLAYWSIETFRRNLCVARMTANLIAIAGAVCLARWAWELWGSGAACAVATLWCFCPNLSSWAATVCPDVHGASLSVVACYLWRRVLLQHGEAQRPRWSLMLATALATGLAMLAKATCLVLPIIQGVMLAAQYTMRRGNRVVFAGACGVWLVMSVGALGVVAAGYGGGEIGWNFARTDDGGSDRHRPDLLHEACWTALPIPLPAEYLRGVFQQWKEFQRGKRSFWRGQWSERGWWWYYLAAAAVKLPVSCFAMLALSGQAFWRECRERSEFSECERSRKSMARLEAVWVVIPFAVFLLVASSQTGFSHHFRYAFPCLPWLYLLSVRFVADSRVNRFAWLLILLFVTSTLRVMPYGHSYFSEWAGGPSCGADYLLESNLEWGEDIYDAARWVQVHPECRPVFRAFYFDAVARHMRVDWKLPSKDRLTAGWYIVSAQRVADPNDRFHFLASQKYLTSIGYGLRIYYISRDELARFATTKRL